MNEDKKFLLEVTNAERIEKLESQNIGDNLDNMDTSIIQMKQELSELKEIINRHKLGVKGEFYFFNKQIAIERIEDVLQEFFDVMEAYSCTEISDEIKRLKDRLGKGDRD